MSIIGWLIIGALAGWIASIITGHNERMGCLANILVGIVGAFVGGFLYSFLTDADFVAGFNLGTLLVAIVGAVVILFLWGLLRREP